MAKEEFYNLHRGYLNLHQVVVDILDYFEETPDKDYRIVVGSDSSSEDNPTFPVVIVVLRVGEGGRFFVNKIRYLNQKQKFTNIHQRILQEVVLSCEIALDVREELQKQVEDRGCDVDYEFRYIHADVGESGITKDMIQEVVSLINSNGFEAKIKPSSYAASIVADRYT